MEWQLSSVYATYFMRAAAVRSDRSMLVVLTVACKLKLRDGVANDLALSQVSFVRRFPDMLALGIRAVWLIVVMGRKGRIGFWHFREFAFLGLPVNQLFRSTQLISRTIWKRALEPDHSFIEQHPAA